MANSGDDIVLNVLGQTDKACGIATDTDDDVVILLGILLRLYEGINVGYVTLEDVSALLEEGHEEGFRYRLACPGRIEIPHSGRASCKALEGKAGAGVHSCSYALGHGHSLGSYRLSHRYTRFSAVGYPPPLIPQKASGDKLVFDFHPSL